LGSFASGNLQVPQGKHWTPIFLLLKGFASTPLFFCLRQLGQGSGAQRFGNFPLGSASKFPNGSIILILVLLKNYFSLNNLASEMEPSWMTPFSYDIFEAFISRSHPYKIMAIKKSI
jgi:hypothetical protein